MMTHDSVNDWPDHLGLLGPERSAISGCVGQEACMPPAQHDMRPLPEYGLYHFLHAQCSRHQDEKGWVRWMSDRTATDAHCTCRSMLIWYSNSCQMEICSMRWQIQIWRSFCPGIEGEGHASLHKKHATSEVPRWQWHAY